MKVMPRKSWRAWLIRAINTGLPIAAGFIALGTSLYLVNELDRASGQFSEYYVWFLGFSLLALTGLLVTIAYRLWELWQIWRRGEAGARLRVRLVTVFVALVLPPAAVIYVFSVQFLRQSVDSWFDVQVDSALQDALTLGQRFIEQQSRQGLREGEDMAAALYGQTGPEAGKSLGRLLDGSRAVELALFASDGRLLTARFVSADQVTPHYPEASVLAQAMARGHYAAAELLGETLALRVVVPVNSDRPGARPDVLQAIYPLPAEIAELAKQVEQQYAAYQRLTYLQLPLKLSFGIVLSMVLAFSVLLAVLAALSAARRLVKPLGNLVEATRTVAAGNYTERLPVPGNDDLGFLVRSFNLMTEEIASKSQLAQASQSRVERERAYLQAVLSSLSSGVLTLDSDSQIRAANTTAEEILDTRASSFLGNTPADIAISTPPLKALFELIGERCGQHSGVWSSEVAIQASTGRRILMCRGASFSSPEGLDSGYVVVFDDITVLIQAQRHAAWGEVARRLAHEVKNPLTPIQLAAERVRAKYLPQLDEGTEGVLDRCTRTIVSQVDALKNMVDAFSDYAKPPRIPPHPVDLADLLRDVAQLYGIGRTSLEFHMDLAENMPPLRGDPTRLRQVLLNLIGNAADAVQGQTDARLVLETTAEQSQGVDWIRLVVEDNGPGFPESILGRVFEPYATTKRHGTGLGLAIARKIVEEHGGWIRAENVASGGARITVMLPVQGPDAIAVA